MIKRLSSLLLLALLFVGPQSFLSCRLVGGEDFSGGSARPLLTGYWRSSYGDGFEISGVTFTAYDDGDRTSISYAGTIVNDPDLVAESAFLTLRITDGGTWKMGVGKYLVAHLKDYTGTTVRWSTAHRVGSLLNSGADTRAAAEMEFTVPNGYFAFYGDYRKQ